MWSLHLILGWSDVGWIGKVGGGGGTIFEGEKIVLGNFGRWSVSLVLGGAGVGLSGKGGGGGRTHFEGEKILFGNSVDRVQIILCAKGTAILLNIPQESDGLPWPTSTPNPTT